MLPLLLLNSVQLHIAYRRRPACRRRRRFNPLQVAPAEPGQVCGAANGTWVTAFLWVLTPRAQAVRRRPQRALWRGGRRAPAAASGVLQAAARLQCSVPRQPQPQRSSTSGSADLRRASVAAAAPPPRLASLRGEHC